MAEAPIRFQADEGLVQLTVKASDSGSRAGSPDNVVTGQNVMSAALAMQEVPYKAQVQRGVYQADALLSSHSKGVAEVMLIVERLGDHLANLPRRYVAMMLSAHRQTKGLHAS